MSFARAESRHVRVASRATPGLQGVRSWALRWPARGRGAAGACMTKQHAGKGLAARAKQQRAGRRRTSHRRCASRQGARGPRKSPSPCCATLQELHGEGVLSCAMKTCTRPRPQNENQPAKVHVPGLTRKGWHARHVRRCKNLAWRCIPLWGHSADRLTAFWAATEKSGV